MPNIVLPQVTKIQIDVEDLVLTQTKDFIDFIESILQNCKNLISFQISGIQKFPSMIPYMSQNFPNSCVMSSTYFLMKHLPLIISCVRKFSDLEKFAHPNKIQLLTVNSSNFEHPFDDGWQNYKTLLTLCPHLKQILIYSGSNGKDLLPNIDKISPKNQAIWKERIKYLNSVGIKIVDTQKFEEFCNRAIYRTKPAFVFG